MAQRVAGEQYESITGQLFEIGRQLRQLNGYPYDPAALKKHLQDAIEGRFQITEANEIAENGFTSARYFITGNDLSILPDFAKWILPAYPGKIPKRSIEGVDSVDLPCVMRDSKIITEYLGGEEGVREYAFTPDQVAKLIDAQKGGKAGEMLNDGRSNIFYVIGKNGVLFAVHVRRDYFSGKWHVDAYEFDDDFWIVGDRVFRDKA